MKGIFTTLVFFVFLNLCAQKIEIEIDTNAIKIGQQTRLTITFDIPQNVENVLIPSLPTDTITKHIEIVEKSAIDTIIAKQNLESIIKLVARISITSFDTGKHVIPPFRMYLIQNNDTTLIQSDSVFLQVATIPADTTQPIKDIKLPWRVPITFRDVASYLIPTFILLALILLFLYIWQRRRKGLPIFPRKKEIYIPPYDEVIEKLEYLKKNKLWQQGQEKLYYSLLSDAIRRYIERQFNIRAMEMTTSETLSHIEQQQELKQHKDSLDHILSISDLVKFAKYSPIVTEHENCLSLSFKFVEATKPQPILENDSPESQIKRQ